MQSPFTISDQVQRTRMKSGGGGFEDVMEVFFTSDRGISGSVTIPLSQYTPQRVKDEVQERVNNLHAVADL